MASTPLIDQADIHKSCKSLEVLVSVLAAYTETVNSLASIRKKLSKALKDAASVKGTCNVPSNALAVTAGIFEALSEVDLKFAKITEKESENIGNDLRKWFKKLAKEEKAHDERMTNGNAKIKQAGQSYERKAKRKDRDVAEEHSRYVAILNTVGPEMAQDRYNHALFVTQRHTTALSDLAGSLAKIAEFEWGRACEHVRRCAPSIGQLGQCRALCEGGWTGTLPGDLPSVDDQTSNEPERKQTNMPDRPITHTPPIVSDVDSPVPHRPKPSLYTPNPSGAPRSADTLSVPPVSPVTRRRETTPHTSTEDLASTGHLQEVQASSRDNSSDQPSSQPTAESDIESSSKKTATFETPKLNSTDIPAETTADPSPVRQDTPPIASSQTLKPQPNVVERSLVKDAEIEDHPSGKPRYTASPESSKMPTVDSTSETHILDREMSAESSRSGGSLVANMRERYDSRPTNPPSSPPPRDFPRTTQRVLDLATRYTPLDAPSPITRSDGSLSAQTGFAGDRFMTFQERYSQNNSYGTYSGREAREYFDERVEPRPHYNTMTPVQGRNQILRDDRDRDEDRYHSLRPPGRQQPPERQLVDDFGTHDRLGRYERTDELTLQEREANLREQERRLEIERARLASARDGGYISDSARSRGGGGNSPYGERQLSVSPGRMSSQQSLLPPTPLDEHSPNCGCQRCSAQHYASSTSGRGRRDSGAVQFKPDPPIQLRPEKPKGWLRRMSMPVASIASPNENKGPSIPSAPTPQRSYIDLPTEDGRIRRRSFEGEQARPSGRYTSTERRR